MKSLNKGSPDSSSLINKYLGNAASVRKMTEDFSPQHFTIYQLFQYETWLLGHPVFLHSSKCIAYTCLPECIYIHSCNVPVAVFGSRERRARNAAWREHLDFPLRQTYSCLLSLSFLRSRAVSFLPFCTYGTTWNLEPSQLPANGSQDERPIWEFRFSYILNTIEVREEAKIYFPIVTKCMGHFATIPWTSEPLIWLCRHQLFKKGRVTNKPQIFVWKNSILIKISYDEQFSDGTG